jgi:prepilin signal peptidase PulO-like enzyme (type II secretory pathway)
MMPVPGMAVLYLSVVDTLLIAGTTVAGLVIGAVLDPVGQREAERSHREDERRRAERIAVAEGEDASSTGGAGLAPGSEGPHRSAIGQVEEAVEHVEGAIGEALDAADADDSDDPAPEDRTVPNLLPQGTAPTRTAAAAVLTAALFGLAAGHFGRHLVLAPYCVFFALLVAISVTDLSHRLVPRRLIYGALALIAPLLVAASAVDHTWSSLDGALIGGAVAFGLFFAVWWFIPRGMGFGDVRLAGVIGFTTGWLSLLHAYVAFLAGFLVGMVFGLILMALSSAGRRTRIPFAPSLSVGAVIAVFWGSHIAQSLFHAGS